MVERDRHIGRTIDRRGGVDGSRFLHRSQGRNVPGERHLPGAKHPTLGGADAYSNGLQYPTHRPIVVPDHVRQERGMLRGAIFECVRQDLAIGAAVRDRHSRTCEAVDQTGMDLGGRRVGDTKRPGDSAEEGSTYPAQRPFPAASFGDRQAGTTTDCEWRDTCCP